MQRTKQAKNSSKKKRYTRSASLKRTPNLQKQRIAGGNSDNRTFEKRIADKVNNKKNASISNFHAVAQGAKTAKKHALAQKAKTDAIIAEVDKHDRLKKLEACDNTSNKGVFETLGCGWNKLTSKYWYGDKKEEEQHDHANVKGGSRDYQHSKRKSSKRLKHTTKRKISRNKKR